MSVPPDPPARSTGPIPFDARRQARALYWQGHGISQVAELLGLVRATVESWKQRGKWDETAPLERVETTLDARLQILIAKEQKTGGDFKEIDLLGRQLERTARVRRFEAPGGTEGDLNPNIDARNAGPKKKKRKNYLDRDAQKLLLDAFEEGLFDYQLDWRGSKGELLGNSSLTRFILKSRQIGATFYFAREAVVRAIETGNNQIFLSASRNQANLFRQYIVDFVSSVTGVKLEGDPIVLDLEGVTGPNAEPPKFYFLGTNYRTAQGYHGDVYIDEVFWIFGFEQIDKVASAMASQKRYRRTYFSTPSTVAHEAHKRWSGQRFNDRRPKHERKRFDISHGALKDGWLGPDRIWRQIVTIEDAERRGCTLFDVAELRLDYSVDEFDNLYLCNFIDDTKSMFPMSILQPCMVDSWETWQSDFDPYALKPFCYGEVWIGYDPQESAAGDDGACVVIAPPRAPGGKFRVLEKFRWKGLDFEAQAGKLIAMLDRYNVGFIGIDTTGIGAAVWQLVVKKFPTAVRFDYNVALKTQMVLKAKNVITNGRLEFDAGAIDIAQSFMAIHAELTASQRQVTYVASRAGDTGHADLAWAIMHALFNEPLEGGDPAARQTRVEIY